ncbi:MAG: hypothetical protein IJJ10_06580 [Bacillus sp. (in: Bacteria)]|nr:hypothetical protein [Bacillus sp. (in: firmicutes)]
MPKKIKLKRKMTTKEINQLIDDFVMMEAVVIGQQKYLESIGKLEEAKKYVRSFMAQFKKTKDPNNLVKEMDGLDDNRRSGEVQD